MASRVSSWMSSSDCSHIEPSFCGSAGLPWRPSILYIQCAAMPLSATACIAPVRIWNSTAVPSGLTSVVCSDW